MVVMLKIKDNVDLKELEKFGFEDVANVDEYLIMNDWGEIDYNFTGTYLKVVGEGRRGQYYHLLVDKDSKIISEYATKPDGDGCSCELDGTLYDLIQAGLVEKVEE